MDVRLPYAAGYALEIDLLILLWGASAFFWLCCSLRRDDVRPLRYFAAWSCVLWFTGVCRAVYPWLTSPSSDTRFPEAVFVALGAANAGILAYGVLKGIPAMREWLGKWGCWSLAAVAGLSNLFLSAAGGFGAAGCLSALWLVLWILEGRTRRKWSLAACASWGVLALGVALHRDFADGMLTALADGEFSGGAYRELAALFLILLGSVCVLVQACTGWVVRRADAVIGLILGFVFVGGIAAGDQFLRREFAREIQTRLAIGAGAIGDADADLLWQGVGETWIDIYSKTWRSLSQVRRADARMAHVYALALRGGRFRIPVEGTKSWGEAQPLDDEKRLGKVALDVRFFPTHRPSFTPPMRMENGTVVTVSLPVRDQGTRGGLFVCADYTLGDWTQHLLWWRFPMLMLGAGGLVVLWLWLRKRRTLVPEVKTSAAVEALGRELRAPLQGILGYADLLKLNPGDPEAEENLKSLRNDASYLAHLVRQMLDLAALKNGGLVMRPERVELHPFFETAIAGEASEAAAKALELSVEIAPRVPEAIYIDGTRYRQVVVNLVSNALRFTEEGSVRLRVDWDAARRQLVCVVKDTGIGMTPEDCRRVFGVSDTGNAPTLEGPEGWGLGLSITRQLIECMKGELTVVSKTGLGTEVTVVLPAEPMSNEMIPLNEGPEMMAGLVVWIVEDQTAIGHLFVEYALSLGAAPTLLKSLRETREHLQEFSAPDVVIVDRKLDDGDGFDLTREPEMRSTARVWRVAMSADDSENWRVKARDLGWDAFLVKPCTRSEFAATIASCPWFRERWGRVGISSEPWGLADDQKRALQREVRGLVGEVDVLVLGGDPRAFGKRLHALRNCLIFLGPDCEPLKTSLAALEEKAREGYLDREGWANLRASLTNVSVNE